MRCAKCSKKLLIEYKCKCEMIFCITHLYSEMHSCTYDYKQDEKKRIEQSLPCVITPKMEKI
jgi:hypothetical protein